MLMASAKMAAPRHAASVTLGTRRGVLQMSAFIWSHMSLFAPPPVSSHFSFLFFPEFAKAI